MKDVGDACRPLSVSGSDVVSSVTVDRGASLRPYPCIESTWASYEVSASPKKSESGLPDPRPAPRCVKPPWNRRGGALAVRLLGWAPPRVGSGSVGSPTWASDDVPLLGFIV